MKTKFYFMILLCAALLPISCNTNKHNAALQDNVTESKIFYEPEQQPHYLQGGSEGLLNDLYSTMLKIAPATQDCVSGRAVVRFTINKQGLIDHNSIKVIRNKSVPEDYLNAAMEAIKLFGRFEPGKLNGTPVSVTYNLPILYPIPYKYIKAE